MVFRKHRYIFTLMTLLVLASCQSETSSLVDNAHLYQPTEYDVQYRDARKQEGYASSMPSTGDVRILVIPVQFTDYPCSALSEGCAGTKDQIETVFFGEADETGWESVASFYEKASYGKLHITGVVSDWFTPPYTAVEVAENAAENSVVTMVTRNAISWYKETYEDSGQQFDSDSDGFIDAIWFIYSLEYKPKGGEMPEDSSIFWAFTAYNSGVRNVDYPGVFQFSWASYKFMYEDGWFERDEDGFLILDGNGDPFFHNWTDTEGNILIDAHTYVHETGHLLGLWDYYTYDEVDWGATGGIDMMDYNIGDHNAFSKSVLDWTTPKVVMGSTRVTLSPFESSGETLLLMPSYNDTLVDEYLLIEFYTPTGLNQKDALHSFAGFYPKTFSIPGIKVYHIDARLGKFKDLSGVETLLGYTPTLRTLDGSHAKIAHSNTASKSGDPAFKLIHLLESNGENSFKHGGKATDEALFVEGDSFGYDVFANYTLDSGYSLNYRFTVTALTESEATLEIYKI